MRSDIYSLGCTLYHMVTGDPPFKGLPAAEVVQKHSSATVPWPSQANPDVSEGLSRIIAKAMAKAPDERYETPADFGAQLDMLAEGCEPDALAAPPRKSTVAGAPRAKVRAAPAGRRAAPKRWGAAAPRRAREHARAPSRPEASKLLYVLGGGGAGLAALLVLFLVGGSWFFDVGYKCRSAFRHHNIPARPYHTLGFRAVVSLSPLPEADGKKGTMSPATAKLVAEFVTAGKMEEVYWDSLKASVVDVLADKQTGVDTGIECAPAAKYVIVPHPVDKWSPRKKVSVGYKGYRLKKFESRNLLASLCYTAGPDAFEDRMAAATAPLLSGKQGRLKLVLNDNVGDSYADNHGRIRVKVMTVTEAGKGGAGAPAGVAASSIAGRWYYEEFGNSYSREFTAEGKCVFRKGETFVWSLPYRMVEGKAIIIMPDGLVLRHELTAEGRLDIEGKFLATRKD